MNSWILKRWNELNDLLDGCLNRMESGRFYEMTAKEQQELVNRSHEISRRMDNLLSSGKEHK